MNILRTPEDQFDDLPDYPFQPKYVEIEQGLRMHYVDEGPTSGKVILLLHGEPSWSYLYRKMIPILVEAGYRAIAPDLIGFGKSDKLAAQTDYSYAGHLSWMRTFLDQLDLQTIHMFCQDWGGLIGLRLLAESPNRFASVVAANTFLPTGKQEMPDAFMKWRTYSQTDPMFRAGKILDHSTVQPLSEEVIAAYDAPFPNELYKAGSRVFPMLVPISENDPEAQANTAAWAALAKFERPFLTLFSDSDPIMSGAEKVFIKLVPGAADQAHTIIENAGHFLQEDKGEEIAGLMVDFLKKNFG